MERKQPFMFFPTVQLRIIAGLLSFTGIIIIVFWVAINEPARMQEFTERIEGRKVETGATLFEGNCSTCHGNEGYGIANRAPALNNPVLFGYNFFAEQDVEIARISDAIDTMDASNQARVALVEQINEKIEGNPDLNALVMRLEEMDINNPERFALQAEIEALIAENAELVALITELNEMDANNPERVSLTRELDYWQIQRGKVYDDLRYNYGPELAEFEAEYTTNTEDGFLLANIEGYQALMEPYNTIFNARNRQLEILQEIEAEGADEEALQAEFDELQSTIVDNVELRETAFNALLEDGLILRPFDPEFVPRLDALSWSGGAHAFIYSTIQSGRPVSNTYWNDPMAAWGQGAGGPLRNDEIEALADYIMNWDREFTREDVRKIQQYAVVVPDCVREGTCEGGTDEVDENLPQLGSPDGVDRMTYIEQSMEVLDQYEGDPVNGQVLYNAQGCAGCHIVGASAPGPDPTGLALRAEEHAAEFGFEDGTWYIAESILDPDAYTVEGYTVLMVAPYWNDLTEQQIADLIAYLSSFDN